jgi:hypothetical protein
MQNLVFVLVVGVNANACGPGAHSPNSTNSTQSVVPIEANATTILKFIQSKLDINQKVYIEGEPILGDGVGQGALNKCRGFAPQHVTSPDKPSVKVCGTGIKMTAYLMGACKGYYKHSRTIGKCQASMSPDTCDSYSPAQDATFGAYQSYKIEPC